MKKNFPPAYRFLITRLIT